MSRRSKDRSADALEALAAAFIARELYPSARQLVGYLDETDEDEIRADVRSAADALSEFAERLRSLASDAVRVDPEAEVADSAELQELRARLAEAEESLAEQAKQVDELKQQGERQIAEHANEVARLNARFEEKVTEIVDLELNAYEFREDIHKLTAKSETLAAALRGQTEAPPELYVADDDLEAKYTITGVIEIARDEFDRVVVPDAALKEIDALEADEKSGDWARELLKGFRALQAYAEEAKFFAGGFWEWCEHSNNPDTWYASASKLAMSESDTVMENARLMRQRRFVVDQQVDPTGYQVMQAHMKIAEGGGQNIPRLYFWDDVKGRTGKMHVGFIGPHRLVQNTKD